MNSEISRLQKALNEAKRERDAIAYKLVQAQGEIEELEGQLAERDNQLEEQGRLFDEIRAKIGPVSGFEDFRHTHLMNLVDAVSRLKPAQPVYVKEAT